VTSPGSGTSFHSDLSVLLFALDDRCENRIRHLSVMVLGLRRSVVVLKFTVLDDGLGPRTSSLTGEFNSTTRVVIKNAAH